MRHFRPLIWLLFPNQASKNPESYQAAKLGQNTYFNSKINNCGPFGKKLWPITCFATP